MDIFNEDKKLQKNAAYDLIKGRMFNKIKNNLVLKEENYNSLFENNDDFSTIKKQKEFFLKKKYERLAKKKLNILTDSIPKLFNTERITRRFEDLHKTPEEFLNENFTKEEIEIMIKNVNYFKLNKEPLKDWDLNINLTLKDTLNKEDEILAQKVKSQRNGLGKKLSLDFNFDTDKKNYEKKKNESLVIENNDNVNIISEKYLKKEKYRNIPKLNLKNIKHLDTLETNKIIKKFRFCINSKNKLLYMIPTNCSRHKKHIKMNNFTDRSQNSKEIYKKTVLKAESNIKHIERFENKKSQKNEFVETQNILNEIKSNYMKINHEKVTQDNIKKNKIKFNDELKTNIKDKSKRKKTNSLYVRIGQNDHILLSERLWK